MKILFTFLTFGKNVFGGIERATYNLALGLISVGVDVVVYTGKAYSATGVTEGIRIYASEYLQNLFTGKDKDIFSHYEKNAVFIKNEFYEIYEIEKPDVVICVDHLWGILPVLDIDILCKKILWFHVAHNENLMRRALNSGFTIYAVSSFLASQLKEYTDETISILPNSIIYDAFQKLRNPQRIVFCNVRISPEKRVIDAVKAFKIFSDKYPGYALHLCKGGFPFGSTNQSLMEINEYLSQNPDFNVVFHDNLSWYEIPDYLTTCNAVVLPTEIETFGIAALETMAAGVPLVATKAGNLPYLIGGSGILTEIGNIKGLADGLARAIMGKTDLILGQTLAKRYDYIRVAQRFLNGLIS